MFVCLCVRFPSLCFPPLYLCSSVMILLRVLPALSGALSISSFSSACLLVCVCASSSVIYILCVSIRMCSLHSSSSSAFLLLLLILCVFSPLRFFSSVFLLICSYSGLLLRSVPPAFLRGRRTGHFPARCALPPHPWCVCVPKQHLSNLVWSVWLLCQRGEHSRALQSS